MEHALKIDEPFLKAKLEGNKLFEIVVNDSDYKKGDFVVYTEYRINQKPVRHRYEITYVTSHSQKDGYIVFGEKYISSVEF